MPRSRKKPAKKAAAKGAKAKVQTLDAEEEPGGAVAVARAAVARAARQNLDAEEEPAPSPSRAARLTPVEAVMVCDGFMSSLAALLTEGAVEHIKSYAEEEGVAMTEERAKAQATEEVARVLCATRGEEPCGVVHRHAVASGPWLVDALRSAAPPAPPATLLRLLRKTSQLRLRSALPDDDAAVAPLVAARVRAMLAGQKRKTSERKTMESLHLAGWFAAQQIWLDPRGVVLDKEPALVAPWRRLLDSGRTILELQASNELFGPCRAAWHSTGGSGRADRTSELSVESKSFDPGYRRALPARARRRRAAAGGLRARDDQRRRRRARSQRHVRLLPHAVRRPLEPLARRVPRLRVPEPLPARGARRPAAAAAPELHGVRPGRDARLPSLRVRQRPAAVTIFERFWVGKR